MTQSQYLDNLARIEQGNPGEVLLPTLQKGFNRANVTYMKSALKRLPEADPDEVPDQVDEPAAPAPRPADETLKALWAERTRLFGEMNRMSNHFHECRTDQERANNSKAIQRKWDEIEAVKGKIRHYEEHGEVPPAGGEEEQFPLPDDPIALVKKLNSIRAQISQTEAKLREAAELPEGHPDRETRIQEGEKKRAYLVLYRGHAEQKVRGKTVHPE